MVVTTLRHTHALQGRHRDQRPSIKSPGGHVLLTESFCSGQLDLVKTSRLHRTAKHTALRKRQGLQVKAVVPLPLVAAAALAPLGWIALGGEKAAVTPLQALKLLTEDRQVLLVDIRSKEGRSSGGSPDLKAIKGTTVQIPYLVVSGRPCTIQTGRLFRSYFGLHPLMQFAWLWQSTSINTDLQIW